MSMRVDGCAGNLMRRSTCDATRLRVGCEAPVTTCILAALGFWFHVEVVGNNGGLHSLYSGSASQGIPQGGQLELDSASGTVFAFRDSTCSGRPAVCVQPGAPTSRQCGPSGATQSQLPFISDSAYQTELVFVNQFWAPLGRTTTLCQIDRELVCLAPAVPAGSTTDVWLCYSAGAGQPVLFQPQFPNVTAPIFVSLGFKLAGETFGGPFRWRRYGSVTWYVIFDNQQTLPVSRATLLSEMAAGRVKCYCEFLPEIVTINGAPLTGMAFLPNDFGHYGTGSSGSFSVIGPQSTLASVDSGQPTRFIADRSWSTVRRETTVLTQACSSPTHDVVCSGGCSISSTETSNQPTTTLVIL